MMRVLLAAVLITLFSTSPVCGQPSAQDIAEEVANNVSSEYATCIAYFSIAKEALVRSGSEKKHIEDMDNAIQKAMLYAASSFQQTGKSGEMIGKVMGARITNEMESMAKEIDHDFNHISILMAKYTNRCSEIIMNPTEITDYWEKKILAKYGIGESLSQ